MALRPGRCYHELKKRPYTRIAIRKPRKSFVKGVPASKIHQFEMGKNKEYPLKFFLQSKARKMRSNKFINAGINKGFLNTDYSKSTVISLTPENSFSDLPPILTGRRSGKLTEAIPRFNKTLTFFTFPIKYLKFC